MTAPNLKTDRLILRHWKPEDLPEFAKMNADKEVMEFFPATLTPEESNALAQTCIEELEEKDYGLWAVEVKEGPSFIGFVGLHHHSFPAHFTPCVEIGWRIAKDYWGKGYAYEAAKEALRYGFEELKLPEIVSMTTVKNRRSRKLMEKLGLTHDPADDFENPKVPDGHPIKPQVLYRIKKTDYTQST